MWLSFLLKKQNKKNTNKRKKKKNRNGLVVAQLHKILLQTYKKKEGMIVTQMPTPATANQFLRLILQEQCHVAVMMNEENPDDTVR